MTYTTPAQAAANIRAALKAHGWGPREVSIRSESFSMGSAVRIEIKSARVPLDVVKATAEAEEHIRRDGNGEILSGGNRYVNVSYSWEALRALAAPHVDAVKTAAEEAHDNILIPVKTAPAFLVGMAGNGGGGPYFRLWNDSGYLTEGAPEQLAARIGQLLIEKGA